MKCFSMQSCISLLLLAITIAPTVAWAWGERGHRIVTEVAVRLVEARHGQEDPELVKILRRKEHMLAHLSNIPDIHWRNSEERISNQNAPTHFIDLEYLLRGAIKPGLQDVPKTMDNYVEYLLSTCERTTENCASGKDLSEQILQVGHGPFRARQLLNDMEQSFRELQRQQKSGNASLEELVRLVDEALLYAGLASHFIGDLANPLHTSKNYDGQFTGQKGIHSYFESKIVATYDLKLSDYVYQYAAKARPFQKITAGDYDRFDKIWLLTLDSFNQLERLIKLDEKYSMLKRGDSEQSAERRLPQEVNKRYLAFVVERLAIGADALAELWIDVWQRSGRPDLSEYKSYEYLLQPEFIPAVYLEEWEQSSQGKAKMPDPAP